MVLELFDDCKTFLEFLFVSSQFWASGFATSPFCCHVIDKSDHIIKASDSLGWISVLKCFLQFQVSIVEDIYSSVFFLEALIEHFLVESTNICTEKESRSKLSSHFGEVGFLWVNISFASSATCIWINVFSFVNKLSVINKDPTCQAEFVSNFLEVLGIPGFD